MILRFVTDEELAMIVHEDVVFLAGQTTSWWEFRRRRLLEERLEADLEFIRYLQERAGRPLL